MCKSELQITKEEEVPCGVPVMQFLPPDLDEHVPAAPSVVDALVWR